MEGGWKISNDRVLDELLPSARESDHDSRVVFVCEE
jgi:hypothetical protein